MKKLLFILMLLVTSINAYGQQHYMGINTVSRHNTGDHSKYNEENWGLFYEHRTEDQVTGVQVGYYYNSFYQDTTYVVGILQPYKVGSVLIGCFMGPAWGYRPHNKPTMLAGGLVTFDITKKVSSHLIVNPAVFALQFRFGW